MTVTVAVREVLLASVSETPEKIASVAVSAIMPAPTGPLATGPLMLVTARISTACWLVAASATVIV